MTRLVLVRHAKAEAPRPALDDHDRALTLEGRSSAQALAQALADAGVEIAVALVSSAVRTQQTWKLMEPTFDGAEAHTEESLYETHVGGVVGLLTALDTEGTVAVVGHEPTISAAAAWLAGPGSDTKALQRIAHGLPTGTAALLDFEGPLRELGQNKAVLTAVCASHAHF
ncbi:SixA phosphatase family protein [Demequina sp.]|uniref:SixA phosphatase family protein n=1 Tax=Demequina sp. TaxID=2050685 RepID=UPI003D0DE023